MKHFTFFIFLSFSCICLAQQQVTHEQVKKLKEEISQSQNEEKLKLLDSLYWLTYKKEEFNQDSISTLYSNFLLKSDLENKLFDSIRVRSQIELVDQIRTNNIPKARRLIAQVFEIIDRNNLDSYYFISKKAEAYALRGILNNQQSHFEKGLQDYLESLKIAEQLADSSLIALANHNLGMSFRWQKDYAKSRLYFKRAIEFRKNLGDSAKLAVSHNMLGVSYFYDYMGDSALFHYKKAKEIYPDKVGKSKANGNIATLYITLKDYNKAIAIYKENIKIFENEKQALDLSIAKFNLGKAYSELGQQKLALNNLNEAIDILTPIKTYEILARQYKVRSLINQRANLLSNALEDYKMHKAFEDSVINVDRIRRLTSLELNYEFEKEQLIDSLQFAKEKEVAESIIVLLNTQNKFKNKCIIIGGIGLSLLFAIIYLIRTKQFVRRKQELQAEFSRNLIQSQEEERTRFARDLHDSVGQKLMLLAKKAKTLRDKEVDALALNTLEEVRSISRGLYPQSLEHLGVTAAITAMVNEVDANTNIFFTNEIENIDALLPKETSLHLYRIIQEALNNMVKHAGAKSASISIERKESNVEVVIKDNGKGFEFLEKLKKNTSLGMKTLLERAKIIKSKLHITSVSNEGTTIELIIPI